MNCHLKCHATPPPRLATEQAGSSEEAESGLRTLRSSVVLPVSWSDQSTDDQENMLLCRICSQPSCSAVPLMTTHCLKVDKA